MRIEQNYKDCVGLSLCVMQELRYKIYKDSKEHYSVIYNGLHESESNNVRDLYFQAYEMEWLDSHWDVLTDLLKRHKNDYKKSAQQDITLFFAEYFSSFMSELDDTTSLAKVAMRELIVAQKAAIEQMIEYSDNWEEKNNQLKVNLKKHKEHFKKLIESSRNKQLEEKGAV